MAGPAKIDYISNKYIYPRNIDNHSGSTSELKSACSIIGSFREKITLVPRPSNRDSLGGAIEAYQ